MAAKSVRGDKLTPHHMPQAAGLTFRQTLYKDIKDVRSIAGSKYNNGLMDLLDYYKQNFPGLMKK